MSAFCPKPEDETEISWWPEVVEIDAAPLSTELKKRWSYFIRKVYEIGPLTCPWPRLIPRMITAHSFRE
jgi:hypothetical protein